MTTHIKVRLANVVKADRLIANGERQGNPSSSFSFQATFFKRRRHDDNGGEKGVAFLIKGDRFRVLKVKR